MASNGSLGDSPWPPADSHGLLPKGAVSRGRSMVPRNLLEQFREAGTEDGSGRMQGQDYGGYVDCGSSSPHLSWRLREGTACSENLVPIVTEGWIGAGTPDSPIRLAIEGVEYVMPTPRCEEGAMVLGPPRKYRKVLSGEAPCEA